MYPSIRITCVARIQARRASVAQEEIRLFDARLRFVPWRHRRLFPLPLRQHPEPPASPPYADRRRPPISRSCVRLDDIWETGRWSRAWSLPGPLAPREHDKLTLIARLMR